MTKLYDQDDQHTDIRTKFDQLKKTHDNTITSEQQVRARPF